MKVGGQSEVENELYLLMRKKGEEEWMPIPDPYVPYQVHKFRDLEINRDQKDFQLRYKIELAYNPFGISEHNKMPKF